MQTQLFQQTKPSSNVARVDIAHEGMAASATTESFSAFIWKSKTNKRLLWIAIAGTIVQFAVFKLCYPFADFFSDSYSYIYGASANLDINIWPIGYSKFLRVFHFLTHSDTALVAFQYFFLELAAVYFFYSLAYFFRPNKSNQTILFVFLFFNPLFLYISNYVNSDPLFAALSLFWITELVWIIQRPKMHQLITQALLLFACFAVRNNAMYYPIIAALAFLLSNYRGWTKVFCIVTSGLLIWSFINYQRNAAYELTGKKRFSLFTGWQLANNALYMYNKINVNNDELPTKETKELNLISKEFLTHLSPGFNAYLNSYVGNFFIKQPEAPLKKYFNKHFSPRTDEDIILTWSKASLVYEDFGSYLIKKYPVAFFKYFILLNTKNYFVPPLEKLAVYNVGKDEVWPEAKDWFDYKSLHVTAVSKTIQRPILIIFPALFFLLNLSFAGCLMVFIGRKRYLIELKYYNKSNLLVGAFIAANAVFSIVTTMAVLRYQFVPLLILVPFTLLLIEKIEQVALSKIPTKDMAFNKTTKALA